MMLRCFVPLRISRVRARVAFAFSLLARQMINS
jgi:hypothetical protein